MLTYIQPPESIKKEQTQLMNKLQLETETTLYQNILQHFSINVEDYDSVSEKVVMKNEEIHLTAIKTIPFSRNDKIKVLDLGCGTGYGMEIILSLFPKASIKGVDFCPKMLATCEERLGKYKGRFGLIEQDILDFESEDEFDVIISMMTIHNVTDSDKLRIFQNIFEMLTANGTFINGDFIKGENDFIDGEVHEIYKNYVKDNLEGKDLTHWLQHIEEDQPMRLSEQFDYLKYSKFTGSKVHWLFCNEAVYSAYK